MNDNNRSPNSGPTYNTLAVIDESSPFWVPQYRPEIENGAWLYQAPSSPSEATKILNEEIERRSKNLKNKNILQFMNNPFTKNLRAEGFDCHLPNDTQFQESLAKSPEIPNRILRSVDKVSGQIRFKIPTGKRVLAEQLPKSLRQKKMARSKQATQLSLVDREDTVYKLTSILPIDRFFWKVDRDGCLILDYDFNPTRIYMKIIGNSDYVNVYKPTILTKSNKEKNNNYLPPKISLDITLKFHEDIQRILHYYYLALLDEASNFIQKAQLGTLLDFNFIVDRMEYYEDWYCSDISHQFSTALLWAYNTLPEGRDDRMKRSDLLNSATLYTGNDRRAPFEVYIGVCGIPKSDLAIEFCPILRIEWRRFPNRKAYLNCRKMIFPNLKETAVFLSAGAVIKQLMKIALIPPLTKDQFENLLSNKKISISQKNERHFRIRIEEHKIADYLLIEVGEKKSSKRKLVKYLKVRISPKFRHMWSTLEY